MKTLRFGQTPISQEMPAGEDVRYEPEFEQLQNEIDKAASLTTDGSTDWDAVVALASTILSRKSKNLLVASYLCVGLAKTRGLEGLEIGLSHYRDLLENFWETLFPPQKRMKGRKAAVAWWLEKLQDILEALPEGTTLDEAAKASISDNLDAIDAFLAERMEDAPLLNPLKSRIARIASPPSDSPATSQTSSQTNAPQIHPTVSPRPPAAAASDSDESALDEDPRKILRQGLVSLRQAAARYRTQNPADPMAYRLARLAAWLDVEKLPPAEDGKTRIPPPDEEIAETLGRLHEQQNFSGLLEYAEARVSQFLFWLDLSRHTAEALDELGHQEAHQAIVEETARYVARLPGIESLAFSDGTPFADPDTAAWIKDIYAQYQSRPAAADVNAVEGPATSDSGEADDRYARARILVKEKKLSEACTLLQEFINSGRSEKLKLIGRMRLVRLLVEAKKPRLALPHVSQIIGSLDQYALEVWEPELALEALVQVYTVLKNQKDDGLKEQSAQVFDRIARLNPAAALQLGG